MGVLAVVTTNDLYQDCESRFWGICALCELPPHRHGLDGQQDTEAGMGGQDGSEGHYQCFCPSSFFFSSLRDGGSGLLVWVNTQGWHGLQKPELEKGIRKEDLYIKAVRIVARDGGLGPAGEGGLK